MGTWRLEAFRMGIYMFFPVALFHYFNQPEYFEAWVTKTKREIYPPDNSSHRAEMEECIRIMKDKREKEMLEQLQNEEYS